MTLTRLRDHIEDWHPEPVMATDHLDPAAADRLAQTLNLAVPQAQPGDELPLPWQWIYFPDWPATAELGVDGHPAQGHFLPPIPHRRRMFAGSRMQVHTPLLLGTPTEKRSAIVSVDEKTGRSGQMLFVTVRSDYSQDGAPALTEEQSLVYRSDDSTPARPFERAADLTARPSTWSWEPTPDTTVLFRYSALTSNAHRIHYDRRYAAQVEGYPDLVVHGPLLATYMAELVRHGSGRPLREFDFRLRRPVFEGDAFRVEADRGEGDSVVMRVVSGDGDEHVTGTGTLA